jgi:hypothetical protein
MCSFLPHQSKLGHLTLLLCTAHTYLYGWNKFLSSSTYKWYTPPGYMLCLVIPSVVLLLKLLLITPCVDRTITRIRQGWERGADQRNPKDSQPLILYRTDCNLSVMTALSSRHELLFLCYYSLKGWLTFNHHLFLGSKPTIYVMFFISPLFNQVDKLRTSSHLQLRPGHDKAKQFDIYNNTELHMEKNKHTVNNTVEK